MRPRGPGRLSSSASTASCTGACSLPDVQAKLAGIGIELAGGTPESLHTEVVEELAKWTKVIREAKIKQE